MHVELDRVKLQTQLSSQGDRMMVAEKEPLGLKEKAFGAWQRWRAKVREDRGWASLRSQRSLRLQLLRLDGRGDTRVEGAASNLHIIVGSHARVRVMAGRWSE